MGSIKSGLGTKPSPQRFEVDFFSRLKTLAQLPMNDWKQPLFRWLHAECHPLGEIRFEVLKVQHRPLGFRAAECVFTLIYCAVEQNDKFVPRNACAIALSRKAEIEADGSRCHALWLALE